MKDNTLAAILIQMFDEDQNMRNSSLSNPAIWDNGIDVRNTTKLKKIISKYGWPTKFLVGYDASNAAWLIVQHADHDIDFQEECLLLMKALPNIEVSQQNIAYLEDRVRIARGKPQMYGTQFDVTAEHFEVKQIDDAINLNKRRAAVGLGKFEEYQELMYRLYKKSV